MVCFISFPTNLLTSSSPLIVCSYSDQSGLLKLKLDFIIPQRKRSNGFPSSEIQIIYNGLMDLYDLTSASIFNKDSHLPPPSIQPSHIDSPAISWTALLTPSPDFALAVSFILKSIPLDLIYRQFPHYFQVLAQMKACQIRKKKNASYPVKLEFQINNEFYTLIMSHILHGTYLF